MRRKHTHLASLPEDCLAAVLALVPFQQRFASCTRVCKRWHLLITSEPELLQTAELTFRRSLSGLRIESGADQDRRLRSMLWMLTRLVPHVRRLLLFVKSPYRVQKAGQLAAELQASLGCCPHLAELSMDLQGMPCTLGPWLAPLAGSLRRLRVAHDCRSPHNHGLLQLQPGSLAACTQLQALVLDGQLSAPSAACWPRGITSLGVSLWFGELPKSVTALQSLQRLRVSRQVGSQDGWRPLRKLTALTQLVLIYCSCLPPPSCLEPLRQLESLELCSTPEGSERGQLDGECKREFDAALAALAGGPLTRLELVDCFYFDRPPKGLSRLSSLRSFRYACGLPPPDRMRLPSGGWLAHLQRLEVPYELIAAQRARTKLEAAAQLEELVVVGLPLPPDGPLPQALQFVPWAAAQPALRRLVVGINVHWHPAQHERRWALRRMLLSAAACQEDTEFHLRQRALAAISALAGAALHAQARRPGLAVCIVPSDKLHPNEQGLECDVFA